MFHSGNFGGETQTFAVKIQHIGLLAVFNRVAGGLRLLDGGNRRTDGGPDWPYLSTFEACMN